MTTFRTKPPFQFLCWTNVTDSGSRRFLIVTWMIWITFDCRGSLSDELAEFPIIWSFWSEWILSASFVESCTDDRNNLSELLIGGYRTKKTIVALSDSICFDALQESIEEYPRRICRPRTRLTHEASFATIIDMTGWPCANLCGSAWLTNCWIQLHVTRLCINLRNLAVDWGLLDEVDHKPDNFSLDFWSRRSPGWVFSPSESHEKEISKQLSDAERKFGRYACDWD